jgi:hypothetical protein
MPFNTAPVWGADVQISMPRPSAEPVMVEMHGFGMTQYRLVHNLTQADYESLAVPVYAPANPTGNVVAGDAGIDGG